jgi:hypothetical protein
MFLTGRAIPLYRVTGVCGNMPRRQMVPYKRNISHILLYWINYRGLLRLSLFPDPLRFQHVLI